MSKQTGQYRRERHKGDRYSQLQKDGRRRRRGVLVDVTFRSNWSFQRSHFVTSNFLNDTVVVKEAICHILFI